MSTIADPKAMYSDDRDERLMLAEASARIPENLAEMLRMRYFQDMTQAELARRLGISQMEVCRRLRKAEKQVRQIVTGEV